MGQVGWLVGWAAALAAMAGRAAAVEERASRVEGRVVQEERAETGPDRLPSPRTSIRLLVALLETSATRLMRKA